MVGIIKQLDINDVTIYVKAGTVLAQKGTKCIDGRYLPNQGHGMLSRPGADCGYVMVLEAINRKKNLGFSTKKCFDLVFAAVKKLNGAFYFHTDEFESTHNPIGCDHLACAARHGFSWEYDVRSKDIKDMMRYARSLCDVSSEIKMINLKGEHEEKGVLIVRSEKYTIIADNPKRHQMYRIYDVDRDRAFMAKLVKQMGIKGVTSEDMHHEADLQLEATLQNMAVGLPVYTVTFEATEPRVTFINKVEYKHLFQRIHLPPHAYFAFPRTR